MSDDHDEQWLAEELERQPNGAVCIRVFRDIGKGAAHRGPSFDPPIPADPVAIRDARSTVMRLAGPGQYFLQEQVQGGKRGRLARISIGAPPGWRPEPEPTKAGESHVGLAGIAAIVTAVGGVVTPLITAIVSRPSSALDDYMKVQTMKAVAKEEGASTKDMMEALKFGLSIGKDGKGPRSETAEIADVLKDGILAFTASKKETSAAASDASSPDVVFAELYELLREKLRAVSEGRAKLDDVLRSWKVLVGAELKPWCAENQTKLMPKLAASEDDRKLVESSGLAQHLAA